MPRRGFHGHSSTQKLPFPTPPVLSGVGGSPDDQELDDARVAVAARPYQGRPPALAHSFKVRTVVKQLVGDIEVTGAGRTAVCVRRWVG